jgi:hypothetical protein
VLRFQSVMPEYLLSVVVASKCDDRGLRKTLLSIQPVVQRAQLQVIVVDYEDRDRPMFLGVDFSFDYLCGVNDGVASAFNNGMQIAKGAYVSILNAGDEFVSEGIGEIVDELHAKSYQVVIASSIIIDGSHERIINPPRKMKKIYLGGMPCQHNCIFVKREVHNLIKGYDERRTVAMDYQYLVSLLGLVRPSDIKITEKLATKFYRGGLSDTLSLVGHLEVLLINLQSRPALLPYVILGLPYTLVRTALRKTLQSFQ